MYSPEQENISTTASTKVPVKYGELIVLGYNGSLPNGDRGRRKSRFALCKRPKANGVKPSTVHVACSPQAAKSSDEVELPSEDRESQAVINRRAWQMRSNRLPCFMENMQSRAEANSRAGQSSDVVELPLEDRESQAGINRRAWQMRSNRLPCFMENMQSRAEANSKAGQSSDEVELPLEDRESQAGINRRAWQMRSNRLPCFMENMQSRAEANSRAGQSSDVVELPLEERESQAGINRRAWQMRSNRLPCFMENMQSRAEANSRAGQDNSTLLSYQSSDEVELPLEDRERVPVINSRAWQAISNKDQHSISYTLSRAQTVVVEYTHDSNTDMFQIGRSTESPIDFVVTDTVAGSQSNADTQSVQSTISRFACRIKCQRTPPYTARIYAAGFDSSKNIFLGEKAAKWKTSDGQMDGLTTNGVLVMHPRNGFTQDSKPGVWREISVCGNVFTLRETRSAQQRGKMVETESQELVDGSLIDLCGATLLWRTAEGLARTPTLKHLEALRQEINAARPQCPVGFNTLAFPSMRRKDTPDEKQPWVYLQCGHVHGYHNWGNHREEREGREGRHRECPMCRAKGPYVPLWLGCEAGFYVDAAPPTHAFNPCGHVCSEKTAAFWSQIPLPHGTHTFHAACPFCAQQLSGEQGYVRLIFQGPLD
ncbi:E3 ubiquitin-protein ligase pellino homolog 1 isoform X8 [Larimichthys crocea]|uniref:E3 ubiquitin-protein ligase pellino homolog 1 isoform X8 n=1 Tax=Larimichthys crocea TaxID=215358 RepID=UPI000F5DD31A|nr:E3 ubiquitin-protein ligase pellino homolog 1 isoform X8 [Larimichthys crocea]